MGDSLSAIHDDEEEYYSLCQKYKQKPVDCYSLHATMLKGLHRDCYDNVPPAKRQERIERFNNEYKAAMKKINDKEKARKKRFEQLKKELSQEDLGILKENL